MPSSVSNSTQGCWHTCSSLCVDHIGADSSGHASHDDHTIGKVAVKAAAPEAQGNGIPQGWHGCQAEALHAAQEDMAAARAAGWCQRQLTP